MKYIWDWSAANFRTPGVLPGVVNLVPNRQGNYETPRHYAQIGTGNTVTGQALYSDIFQKVLGTTRGFVCTSTRIYEFTTSSLTDRSKGGAAYTATNMWNAAQYGDVTIYVSDNLTDPPQASTTGAFADLAGTPPKAKYIAVQNLAVALANYFDGVNQYADGVWISDIGAHTTWTPSSSNEAANFRLLTTPGPITGLVAFKDDLYAFKDSSFYRIKYVGRPFIWTATVVSDAVGAVNQGAICVCPDFILFMGDMGWYTFDGQRLNQVGAPRNERAAAVYYNPKPIDLAFSSSHYEQATGRAYFASSFANGVNAVSQVMAFQTKTGQFGNFSPATANGTIQPPRCIIRGTPKAIQTHGFSATTVSPGSYSLAMWLPSTTNSIPCAGSSKFGSLVADVATMFFPIEGDGVTRWTYRKATPVMGKGSVVPSEYGMSVTSYSDASFTAIEQTKGLIEGVVPTAGVPEFPLNIDARYLLASLSVSKDAEFVDIVFDKVKAGVY